MKPQTRVFSTFDGFRTDVPAPALVVDPPLLTLDMRGGETAYTQYTIKNAGMVSMFDLELTPADDNPAVKIELPFTKLPELRAGQTVVVPVKITLQHASCEPTHIKNGGKYACLAGTVVEIDGSDVRVLAGNTCPKSTGGASGPGGGSSASYDYIGPLESIASLNKDVVMDLGCGMTCLEGTSTGCNPCQICQGGVCVPNPAMDGQSCGKAANICQKMVCRAGSCETEDNSAETNNRVANGELSILDCPNRRSNGVDPIPNGCGTPEAPPLNPTPVECAPEIDFTSDCNQHDTWYQTCNSDPQAKDSADRGLQSLMKVRCNDVAHDNACFNQCTNIADLWYSGLKFLGYIPPKTPLLEAVSSKGAFGEGQNQACTCCP